MKGNYLKLKYFSVFPPFSLHKNSLVANNTIVIQIKGVISI